MSARPRLTIDLGALARNYHTLETLAGSAEVAAVVKADGYGLGLEPVARTLAAAGAKLFFVADAGEALRLRRVLTGAQIYVLAGFAPGTELIFEDPLVAPVLNTSAQVHAYAAAGGGRAALQVDTGMTRLGVAARDLDALAAPLASISLDLVLTHLAAADGPDRSANEAQRARFDVIRRRFPAARASLANSPGMFLGDGFHYDVCRPGIAAYGGNPTLDRPNPMAPVVALDAQILQIHTLHAPAQVGYGGTYAAPAGARIATCAIGYADGLLRCLGNAGTAQAAGVDVPFAGRVSMDLLGLDVSAVPRLAEGDRVQIIWGPDGVDRLAAAADTIAYEVLVRLGPRVERHYVETTT